MEVITNMIHFKKQLNKFIVTLLLLTYLTPTVTVFADEEIIVQEEETNDDGEDIVEEIESVPDSEIEDEAVFYDDVAFLMQQQSVPIDHSVTVPLDIPFLQDITFPDINSGETISLNPGTNTDIQDWTNKVSDQSMTVGSTIDFTDLYEKYYYNNVLSWIYKYNGKTVFVLNTGTAGTELHPVNLANETGQAFRSHFAKYINSDECYMIYVNSNDCQRVDLSGFGKVDKWGSLYVIYDTDTNLKGLTTSSPVTNYSKVSTKATQLCNVVGIDIKSSKISVSRNNSTGDLTGDYFASFAHHLITDINDSATAAQYLQEEISNGTKTFNHYRLSNNLTTGYLQEETYYTSDNEEVKIKTYNFNTSDGYVVGTTDQGSFAVFDNTGRCVSTFRAKEGDLNKIKINDHVLLLEDELSGAGKISIPGHNFTNWSCVKDFLNSKKKSKGVEGKADAYFLSLLQRFAVGHNYDAPILVADENLKAITLGADNAAGNFPSELYLDEVAPSIYNSEAWLDLAGKMYHQSSKDNPKIKTTVMEGMFMQLINSNSRVGKDKALENIKAVDDGKLIGSNTENIEYNQDMYIAESDHTTSSTPLDYAFTNYSRLAYLTSDITNANNVDKPSNFDTFYKSHSSVLGLNGVVYLNEDTPIMITDGSGALLGSGSVREDKMSEDLGAIESTVEEWGAFATTWRKELNGQVDEHGELTPDQSTTLQHLKQAVDDYGVLYPAIKVAWEDDTDSFGDKSLEELANEDFADEDDSTMMLNDSIRISPLDMFFTISVVGLDPSKIGANDPWEWFNGGTSTANVLLSEYMKQGIAMSAAYVPMQTNVYAEDQINLMMEVNEDFVKNFHYKYGFQRKALKLVKSATAVTDFYNTKGTKLGTTTTCTLSDLLEAADNDQEVMLYVDDNFYNYDKLDEAIAPRVAEQRNTVDTAADLAVEVNRDINDVDPNTTQQTQGTQTVQNKYSLSGNITSGSAGENSNLKAFLDVTKLGNVMTLTSNDFVSLTQLLTALKGSTTRTDEKAVKHGSGYTQYDTTLRNQINEVDDTYLAGGNYVDTVVSGSSGYLNTDESALESDDTALNGTRTLDKNNPDCYVFSSFDIADVLDGKTARIEKGDSLTDVLYEYESYDMYTPALSYAYVSAIYRDDQAFTLLQDSSYYSPVFMASESLPGKLAQDPNISARMQDCIFNYALLKNLDSMAQVTYTHTLDMQSPIYIDIYGNILTASGVVIIPAASNATLWSEEWAVQQPSIGLYTCYGNNYYIPYTVQTPQLSSTFESDVDGKYWLVLNRTTYKDTGNSEEGEEGEEKSSKEDDDNLPQATPTKAKNEEGGEPEEDEEGEDGDDTEEGANAPMDNALLNYAQLDEYNTESQMAAIAAMDNFIISNANINWWAYMGIISEVMRGAPIENIDIVKEELTNKNLNAEGIVLAAKLESLETSLKDAMQQNNLLVIPDFTRVDHLEYFIAFFIKVMALFTVAVVIIITYRDGAAGQIGFGTLFRTLGAVFLTFTTITIIPAIFQFSYYGANKFLLQHEAERIAMFSTEKFESGLEVGVTDTTIPDDSNDLMVQLDWVDIPWYEHLQNMVMGSSIAGIEEVRDHAYATSLVANQPDVYQYNDGIYMTISDIFDSATIDYSYGAEIYSTPTSIVKMGDVGASGENTIQGKNLYLHNNTETQTLSYYSPYYVFLKVLVHNINFYNAKMGTYKYTTKYMSGSRLKTVGLGTQYFKSTYFMEDCSDIFHLYNVFGEEPPVQEYDYDLFDDEDTTLMSQSLWYTNYQDSENTFNRVQKMNEYARDFVSENSDLLDKISDETFIKVMALSCAMKFNQIYGVSEANCYEIYNINSDDLLRLCVCKPEDAMLASPMSYPRYLYTYGGELAVYAGAALDMVMWIGSFIKPLCTVLCFISIFMSIFIFKVILRQKGGLTGYLVTALLLCGTNILHALMLKFSTLLPDFHLPVAACLIIVTLGQIAYLLVLANVTGIALRDWSDLGTAYYKSTSMWVRNTMRGESVQTMNSNIPDHKDNWEYYNDMRRTYRERN